MQVGQGKYSIIKKNMKVLVTGGAGFIGSHIVKLLVKKGFEVVVYDNLTRSSSDHLDSKAKFIRGDILDKEDLIKALEGVDGVIHMASLIEVSESVKDPEMFAKNNVLGSVTLLEAMRETKVKKIIFSSTASVYGDKPSSLPITEDSKVLAANPYGASKVAVENFLYSYHFNFGFDVVSLRYFNAYGPGEMHDPETHAVPNFIKAALTNEPIPLYWKGEQVRDFIYVDDLAEAHIAVLDLEGFNVFNVGTEKGVKVMDVIHKIADILGKEVKVEHLGERKGDVQATYASSAKLKKATGWEAKTSLKEGLEKTIDWFSLS